MIHLHNHSSYSLLDGASTPQEYIVKAKQLNMPAIALTEHGNMYSLAQFVYYALNENIKPIIGIEAYYTDERYHMILLARNREGYEILNKLQYESHKNTLRGKPIITERMLKTYVKPNTLIMLTACILGYPTRNITKPNIVEEYIYDMINLFGEENVFIEFMFHGLEREYELYYRLWKLTQKHKWQYVLTNDAHASEKQHLKRRWFWREYKKKVNNNEDEEDISQELYLKPLSEILPFIPSWFNTKKAVENTYRIAEMITYHGEDLYTSTYHLPEIANAHEKLKQLTYQRLKQLNLHNNTEYLQRLEYELNIIHQMNFDAYFLIVADYVNWSKEQGILVGSGRGSAGGSLVAYLLNITEINPIEYELYFERFLNPHKASMPDIDVDFQQDRRHEVMQYLANKYHGAQIQNEVLIKPKLAIRDAGKVLGKEKEADLLARKIPTNISTFAELKETTLFSEKEWKSDIMQLAQEIAQLPKAISIHAGGVVIGDKDITYYLPVKYDEKANTKAVVEANKDFVEKVGLVKMDILGLRTLTVMAQTMKMAGIKQLPTTYDDEKVYKTIQEGKTFGVFQIETPEFTKFIKQLQPTKFNHLISALALFRPATLQSGIAEEYLRRKNEGWQPEKAKYEWEKLFVDTYGLPIYQEQIMKLAQYEVGWSMAEADILRKAIAKKKRDLLDRLYKDWKQRGGSERIWRIIEKFGGYGFNKAHATGYAILTYQTAWLKTYYPLELVAAILTSYIDNKEKLIYNIHRAKQEDFVILPPTLYSHATNFIVQDKAIVAPLKLIKGLSEKQISNIRRNKFSPSVKKKLTKAGITINFNNAMLDNNQVKVNELEAFGFYFHHPLKTFRYHDEFFAIPIQTYIDYDIPEATLIGNIIAVQKYNGFFKATIQDNTGAALIYINNRYAELQQYKGKPQMFVFHVKNGWLQEYQPLDITL